MAKSKLDTIIAREFRERVRSPWFLVSTLVGPLVMVLLFAIPLIIGERERRLDPGRMLVLDASSDSSGRLIASTLNDRSTIISGLPRADWTWVAHTASDVETADAVRDVLKGRFVGVLIVDDKAVADGTVSYYGRNTTALVTMQQIESAARRAITAQRLEAVGIDPERSAQLAATRVQLLTERVTARGLGGSGQVSVFFSLGVALLLYSTIFIHGANVMRGVLEEKESRVAEVVLSSVPSDTLLFGKVLGIGAVGLVQLVVWTVLSTGLIMVRQPLLQSFGLKADRLTLPDLSPEFAIIMVLTFVLGFLFYAGLFAAVGAIVSNEQEAQQAQLPVVMLLVLSLAMVQGVLTNPDGSLARTLTYLPISSPIVLPLRLSLTPVSASQAALALGILALSAFGATLLAARLYRLGVLMYGKRASAREVWMWLWAH